MDILKGKALVDALRSAADGAHERFWVASPYIGGWPGNVRRIIGTHWQENAKDVRLLTDVAARGFRLNTLKQFFRRGPVRTLLGLHAKLYVIDDFVLLTSANLTGTGFSRRFEAGIALSGKPAHDVARLFESWWKKGIAIREEQLPPPKGGSGDPDNPGGPPLPVLNGLPPDVNDQPLPSDSFGDYDAFQECYEDLAKKYLATQRIWKNAPRYFEVDAFLNYLYHHAPGLPSRPYARKQPRTLTSRQQRQQIKKFAPMFANGLRRGDTNESPTWRSERAAKVRRLLTRNLKRGLSRADIEELLLQLNAMNAYRVNLAKVLNPDNNNLTEIRTTLRDFVDEDVPLQRRMSECNERVFGMSKSAIQELVGFYSNGKFPLRNRNTNCGLRFFGYDVRVD
jgi:hypothetical protein